MGGDAKRNKPIKYPCNYAHTYDVRVAIEYMRGPLCVLVSV